MSYLGPVSSNQDGTIINYIPYGTIENNTTRGWSACTLTWSGTTPSGAPTLTATQMAISASSTDPLSNLYSLLLTKSAANAQYQGFISDAFSIKREDLAKVLTGSFYYEVASGTVDMSGTSTQSLEIWVYNVNANQWIQPAGYRGLNQSSGPGLVSFTFQTDSTAANNSYRIAVITQQTSATAYTVKFDNFKLSPQTAPIGPVVTDWVSYTPTGGFTQNVTYTGRWRRVGDSMEVQFAMSFSGVTNSSSMTINLPTGYVVDSSKMTSVGLLDVMASGQIFRMGAGYLLGGYLASSTSIAMSYISNGSNSIETTATNFLPVALALGDTVNGSFRVPIQGWSSNVQLSNDTDTRVVDFKVVQSTNQSISNGVPTKVNFGSVIHDTHGSYSSANSWYVIPVSGYYDLKARISFVYNATGIRYIVAEKNSAQFLAVSPILAATTSAGDYTTVVINEEFYFDAGDRIYINAVQNSGGALSVSNGNAAAENRTALSITRRSGPSVVAASETVAVSATRLAGNYAVNNSTSTFVWNIADIDTHASLNTSTGVFTAPVSGTYEITASTTVFSSVSQLHSTTIRINGNDSANSFHVQDSTNTNYRTLVCNYVVRLNAGTTLDVRVFSSGSATWIGNNTTVPRLTIKRIGN